MESIEEENSPSHIQKEMCQVCNANEHKYKCPRCIQLTCSLQCSKDHKAMTGCTGIKDHISAQRLKMEQITLGTLKKDLRFIDEAITISNASKKRELEIDISSQLKVPKKVKNLRYFLRKKRNITYKHSPPQANFVRSKLNTTLFDSEKLVLWTVELIFYRGSYQSDLIAQIVLNKENMIGEETSLQSFINKDHLKKVFHNEQFSLLLTSIEDLNCARVYIKGTQVIKGAPSIYNASMDDEEEEGQIIQEVEHLKAVYKELDRKSNLREVLDGTIVHEYPTLYVVL